MNTAKTVVIGSPAGRMPGRASQPMLGPYAAVSASRKSSGALGQAVAAIEQRLMKFLQEEPLEPAYRKEFFLLNHP